MPYFSIELKSGTALFAAISVLVAPDLSGAAHLHPEKFYQDQWCAGRGVVEYVLDDKARVDCLTQDSAVEFDFDQKWAESLGQALYYSSKTDRRAGIVLIMESPAKDQKYLERLRSAISHHKLDVQVWLIEVQP